MHLLTVEVLWEEGIWVGLPVNGPGSSGGETFFELFAEVEFSKHFVLQVPKDVPVSVKYFATASQPEIDAELQAAWREFQALPEDIRPKAIAWDHDNNCPASESPASESQLVTH